MSEGDFGFRKFRKREGHSMGWPFSLFPRSDELLIFRNPSIGIHVHLPMTQDQFDYLQALKRSILSGTHKRNNLPVIPVEFPAIFDKMEECSKEIIAMIDLQLQLHSERLSKGFFTLQDFKDGIVSADMRSDSKWTSKIDALRKLLDHAAPNSKRGKDEPKYTFLKFYYISNGEWYGTDHGLLPSVSPLDIIIP